MRNILFSVLILFLFAKAIYAIPQNPYPFNNSQDQLRFDSLTQEIRCLVCQNQNISDSNAPLAKDLRKKVYGMIKENRSNEEIKTYLVNRYGNYILMKPPFEMKTLLLWSFPLLGILLLPVYLFCKFSKCRVD